MNENELAPFGFIGGSFFLWGLALTDPRIDYNPPPARLKGKRPHLDNQRLEAYRGAANSLEPINYLLNDTRVCNLFPGISQSEMTN